MGVLIRPYGFTQSDSSDTQFPGGLEGDGGRKVRREGWVDE